MVIWRVLRPSWRASFSTTLFPAAAALVALTLCFLRRHASRALEHTKTNNDCKDRAKSKVSCKEENARFLEAIKFLAQLPILKSFSRDQIPILAAACIPSSMQAGQSVIFDEIISDFSIVTSGEATVFVSTAEDAPRQVATLTPGKSFGAGSFMVESSNRESRTGLVLTMHVQTDMSLLVLPLDHFRRIGIHETLPFANHEDICVEGSESVDAIKRKDLAKIGLLGCGGFAAVELWEHKRTRETYAMKAVSKGYIRKMGMTDSFFSEKNVLMMTNSPFIIKLHATYNAAQTLYFLLEAALGGELYSTYNRKALHGSDVHAKFYIAGVVLALSHLHERSVVYRSVKPENVVLDSLGFPKLIDFDLAKFVVDRTFTTCGTPDYFAPEVIASTGHSSSVDWWTVGVLTFELMSGNPPFESSYPMQIYSKVTKGICNVTFPLRCQGPVGDLIKALMNHEPSKRLPVRAGGLQKLKDHKWYSGFDWEAFAEFKMDAPYKPIVKSKKDIANFSASKEDMPRPVEYHDDGTGWDKDFATA